MRLPTRTRLIALLLPMAITAAGEGALTDTTAAALKAGVVADTAATASDTTSMLRTAIADTAAVGTAVAKQDSVHQPLPAKQIQPPPVAPAERTSTRKIKLVKRQYNYRQQVVLAVGMMAFIAIMMTTAQSWNPK